MKLRAISESLAAKIALYTSPQVGSRLLFLASLFPRDNKKAM